MLQQLVSPSRQRLPHYSFMRPGDFAWFIFLIAFSAYKLWSAFTLAERFFAEWFGYAVLSCALTAVYVWLRIQRRNICADSGELLLFAVILPQLYKAGWECLFGDSGRFNWEMAAFLSVLCVLLMHHIWKAPKIAKELEELEKLEAVAEEEARNGTADPRFIDIDKP